MVLTPDQAAPIAGVPSYQLMLWAYDDWDVHAKRASGKHGPRNIGTRHKPRYDEDDVREWRHKHDWALVAAVEGALRG